MNFNLILFQLLITTMLAGLIWTIQILHYPSFRFIEPSQFKAFHDFHSNRISLLVVPLMLSELALGLIWIFQERNFYSYSNLGLLVIVWAGTFFLSVPIHNLLRSGFDIELIEKLVNTNWIRTFAWTLKSLLLGILIYQFQNKV